MNRILAPLWGEKNCLPVLKAFLCQCGPICALIYSGLEFRVTCSWLWAVVCGIFSGLLWRTWEQLFPTSVRFDPPTYTILSRQPMGYGSSLNILLRHPVRVWTCALCRSLISRCVKILAFLVHHGLKLWCINSESVLWELRMRWPIGEWQRQAFPGWGEAWGERGGTGLSRMR